MQARNHARNADGLSLVELLAVLAITALLLALAVPGAVGLRHRLLLASLQQDLLMAIRLARSEAQLRGIAVELCPGPGGRDSACDGTYQQGWMVYVDGDRNRVYSAEVDTLLLVAPPLPEGYRLTDRDGRRALAGALGFMPDGSARRSLTLRLCAPVGPRLRSVSAVLSRGGRVRTRRDEAPCPGAPA